MDPAEKDPEILVPLTSTKTGFEAETITQALIAHGVPAQVFGLSAQVMQWELGYHDAIKVMVRRGDLETARDILKAIKADSVDIDWSEVDVGPEPSDITEAVPPGTEASAPSSGRSPSALLVLILVAAALVAATLVRMLMRQTP